MSRLFWKFFLSILLAQLTATVAIGGAIWLRNHENSIEKRADIDTGPHAEETISAATAILEFGGINALKAWLTSTQRHQLYVVDENNHELLQRPMQAATLSAVRRMLTQYTHGIQGEPAVRGVQAPDGHHYVLFLAAPVSRDFAAGLRNREQNPADFNPAPQTQFERDRPPPEGLKPPPHFQPLAPFIPVAAAVVASLVFAALLAWYFSRPILSLRQAFNAASHGDLTPRFAHGARLGGDELNDLGRDFDHMTSQLRTLIERQTRLLHDVSHELRSPLARLQAAIGLAHQQPERMLSYMERIERESMRMDQLLGELLTLARLEAGALRTSQDPIDMAELIEQVLDDAQFEAKVRQRQIQQKGTAEVTVIGQTALLARAIENILRNAIKHSPVDSVVQLELVPDLQAHTLVIRVIDQGAGVPSAELDAIFQAFYRGHNMPKDIEGHGLGLAIAQQVVLAHGGSIRARNQATGGLCVELVLPIVPPI